MVYKAVVWSCVMLLVFFVLVQYLCAGQYFCVRLVLCVQGQYFLCCSSIFVLGYHFSVCWVNIVCVEVPFFCIGVVFLCWGSTFCCVCVALFVVFGQLFWGGSIFWVGVVVQHHKTAVFIWHSEMKHVKEPSNHEDLSIIIDALALIVC